MKEAGGCRLPRWFVNVVQKRMAGHRGGKIKVGGGNYSSHECCEQQVAKFLLFHQEDSGTGLSNLMGRAGTTAHLG